MSDGGVRSATSTSPTTPPGAIKQDILNNVGPAAGVTRAGVDRDWTRP
jgi:hypothetical protein